jgi:hypothetical protein
MKTKIVGVVSAFLLALYSISGITYAGYDRIAECSSGTEDPPAAEVNVLETFVPGVNRIASFAVRIMATPPYTATLDLRDSNDTVLASSAITGEQSDWFAVGLDTPIAVDPAGTYKVFMHDVSGGISIGYVMDPSCYPEGVSSFEGVKAGADINFYVTGYNFVPTPTPTPVATPTPVPTATPTPTPTPTIAPDNLLTGASLDGTDDTQALSGDAESSTDGSLSNLAKILIGIGALLVVATGVFIYLKFFRKKK